MIIAMTGLAQDEATIKTTLDALNPQILESAHNWCFNQIAIQLVDIQVIDGQTLRPTITSKCSSSSDTQLPRKGPELVIIFF
jgi:hypothetical protein